MKKMKIMRAPSLAEVLLLLLLVCLSAYSISNYFTTVTQRAAKERDAHRISDIDQIQSALFQYYTNHNSTYPTCLYTAAKCTTTLEGSTEMTSVPKDPVTSLGYSYASYGKGASCTGYHLGASLERTGSQALLTGSDAPPQATANLCLGSAGDFSGLSYSKGGQPCNLVVGTPQPTDAADGETCYDIARHRPNQSK